MNSVLLLIGLVLLFSWYIRDRVREKKTTAAPPGDYWGTVLKPSAGKLEELCSVTKNIESIDNPIPGPAPGRVYYGIPGRSFKGYIWNGRITTGSN